jgi:hypothetical protein
MIAISLKVARSPRIGSKIAAPTATYAALAQAAIPFSYAIPFAAGPTRLRLSMKPHRQ